MYKIYCDFDSTITLHDVGKQLLDRFAEVGHDLIWEEYLAGTRTAGECLRISLSSFRCADDEALLALIRSQEIRPGFHDFVRFCSEQGLELSIVSDGFSIYIRHILEHHGLQHLPVWTNEIELQADGSLSATLRNEREGCARCASCKCARLLTSSSDEDTIVYIGDGFSDHCPVALADVVFARDELLAECSAQGIPYHPFHNFDEIREHVVRYLRERPKYRREQAHRRRRELITQE